MSGREPFRIGVITDRMDDARAQVIGGLESVVRPLGGVVLIVVHHRQNPVRGGLLRQLAGAGRLDAALVLPLSDAGKGTSRMDEVLPIVAGLPVVTVGARHPDVPMVDVAETVLAAEVMQHLVEDCGRRQPVLVGSSTEEDGSSRRNRAIEHAALTRGVVLGRSEDLLRCVDQHSAQAAFGRWLDQRLGERTASGLPPMRPLDSVVCGSDEIAVGVLATLADHGFVVPQDVSVVSYGNTTASWGASPALSSVDEHLREQGVAAGRYLVDRVFGRTSLVPGRVTTVDAGSLVLRLDDEAASGSGPEVPSEWVDDLADMDTLVGPSSSVAPDDQARAARWRRDRRAELAHGAMLRSNEELHDRLADVFSMWRRAYDGPSPVEEQQAIVEALAAVVRDFPEAVWWRFWVQLLPQRLAEADLPQLRGDAMVQAVLSTSLLIERVLAEARVGRERRAHAMSQQMLELEQSLVGCASLVELTAVLTAFLPRLGVVRCFLGLFDEPLPFDSQGSGSGMSRLVLTYGVPGTATAAATDAELWDAAPVFESGQLLPTSMAGELDHDTLMIQPIFGDEARFGYVAYEGSGQDRHVGETLRLAVARVLETKARTHQLTTRSEELARLVTERTAELRVEIATRRSAQEELRVANEQLRFALLRDGLTGLYNRPALDEHLERAWRQMRRTGEPLSVLMCDVDHFKLYNDVSGHLAGDDCLRRVAHVIQGAAGRPGDLVSRYGGEEFVVVLNATDLEGAEVVADRLVRAVRDAALPHDGTQGLVTMSVGVATSDTHDSVESLLSAADRALYVAKAEGRDCYRSEPGSRVMTPTP